jgi:hypothetical protein
LGSAKAVTVVSPQITASDKGSPIRFIFVLPRFLAYRKALRATWRTRSMKIRLSAWSMFVCEAVHTRHCRTTIDYSAAE